MRPRLTHCARSRLIAILAVLAMLFGATAVTVGTATPAAAGGGYPDDDATDCLATYGQYSWCKGGTWLSGRGYGYRNCTDYVAWRLISEGVSASDVRGLGNGGDWYNNAPAAKRSLTPAAGDAAVKPATSSSPWGHVAYVESVNADGTITVSEFNYDGDGNPGTRTQPAASMGFTEYVDFGLNPVSATAPTDNSQLGVSMAFNPTNGRPTVAVQGPSNSLYVYWQTSSGSWAGPLGIGGSGSTYSAPSIAFNPVTGLPTIAARGPGSRLWVYWQNANGSWSGPLGVGAAGSTYAMPSLAFSPSGNPTVAVQGPSNSLWVYWANGGSWTGPLGVGASGSVYDAPSVAFNSVSGLPTIAVQGPSNTLRIYWQLGGGSWTGPLGVGGASTTYSAPSLAFNASGQATIAAQGPSNSLYAYWMSGSSWAGPLGVGASGSTFSAPSIAFNTDAAGLPAIAVEGPGNRLWLYWQQTTGAWTGPLGIAGSGSTFSAPALAFNPLSATPFIAAEATNHTLWGYWSNSGTWYGPLGIGGSGSAYH